MELVSSLAIGIVFGAGIWLLLRPRSFQVLTGLMLMSYAVNLFIFIMGRVWLDQPPFTPAGSVPDPRVLADPLPMMKMNKLTAYDISIRPVSTWKLRGRSSSQMPAPNTMPMASEATNSIRQSPWQVVIRARRWRRRGAQEAQRRRSAEEAQRP